jgi:CRISPR-associated protein Cst1
MSILRYTGHPLPDVGVATITASAKVSSPSELTEQHITEFIEELVEVYMNAGVAGFLSRNVFANAGFANPAQINDSKYTAQRRELLYGLMNLWRPGAPLPPKLAGSNSDRCMRLLRRPGNCTYIANVYPMITGEESINFLPEGRKGLPVAGWCLLAILAMPMGALKTGANLVLVHSHSEGLLLYFASKNLERNRYVFHTQHLNDMPMYSFAKTYLIKDLLNLQGYPRGNNSITVYKFNSDNQDASVEVFALPSSAVRFVMLARAQCPDAWNYVTRSAQSLESYPERIEQKKSKNRAGEEVVRPTQVYGERNYFYEDLFGLPHNAARFLHRYLLRTPIRLSAKLAKAKEQPDPRLAIHTAKSQKRFHGHWCSYSCWR